MDDYRNGISASGPLGVVRTKGELSGRIEMDGDVDTFRTTLIAGLSYEIEVRAAGHGGGTLPEGLFEVYDPQRGYIGFGFMDEAVSLVADASGTHYILAHNGGFGGTGSYTVAVSAGVATSGADTVTGSADGDGVDGALGDDRIDGRGGDDSLFGGEGRDTLLGGTGNDTLNGASGADSLRGQGGDDLLIGGTGADVLMGGSGRDSFRFDYVDHSLPGQRDVLQAGDGGKAFDGAGSALGDLIDLARIDADATLAGNQKFAFGGTGRGHVSLVDSGTDTLVRANTDGDAAFELEIVIRDGSGVRASAYSEADFML